MFLKLFKHDFTDLKNSFFTLFLIVGIVSFTVPFLWELLSEGLIANITGEKEELSTVLFIIIGGLFINFFYIVEILFVVVTLRNFARSFYGNEGYFTLTLPISTAKNVISKILAMIVWGLLFFLVAVIGLTISIFIVLSISGYCDFNSLKQLLTSEDFTNLLSSSAWQITYNILESFFSTVLLLCAILFAMTLAHIKPFNKHSILFTILFLIGMGIITIIYISLVFNVNDSLIKISQIVTLCISVALIPLLVLAIIKLIDKKVEIQ